MWSTTQVNNTLIASGAQNVPIDLALDLVTAGVGVLGGTLVRTHLGLSLAAPIADGNPGVTYGIVVYDKAHVTVNQPSITSDVNIDWMIEKLCTPGTSDQSMTSSSSFLFGTQLDLRSKRRLHEVDDRPFLVILNNGTMSVTFSVFAKCLFALP